LKPIKQGVNLAAIWDLPVIFACENNLYGASTPVLQTTRLERIADRAAGYGIRGERVYGNDVLAVYQATRQAARECREGKGPVLLELLAYRTTGHSRRDPCHYQPKEEKEHWAKQDPIRLFGCALVKCRVVEEEELQQVKSKVRQQIDQAVEMARREPGPTIDDLTTEVFCQ
jgi:pyruvate dehydrogenase E1 component alpha subunit